MRVAYACALALCLAALLVDAAVAAGDASSTRRRASNATSSTSATLVDDVDDAAAVRGADFVDERLLAVDLHSLRVDPVTGEPLNMPPLDFSHHRFAQLRLFDDDVDDDASDADSDSDSDADSDSDSDDEPVLPSHLFKTVRVYVDEHGEEVHVEDADDADADFAAAAADAADADDERVKRHNAQRSFVTKRLRAPLPCKTHYVAEAQRRRLERRRERALAERRASVEAARRRRREAEARGELRRRRDGEQSTTATVTVYTPTSRCTGFMLVGWSGITDEMIAAATWISVWPASATSVSGALDSDHMFFYPTTESGSEALFLPAGLEEGTWHAGALDFSTYEPVSQTSTFEVVCPSNEQPPLTCWGHECDEPSVRDAYYAVQSTTVRAALFIVNDAMPRELVPTKLAAVKAQLADAGIVLDLPDEHVYYKQVNNVDKDRSTARGSRHDLCLPHSSERERKFDKAFERLRRKIVPRAVNAERLTIVVACQRGGNALLGFAHLPIYASYLKRSKGGVYINGHASVTHDLADSTFAHEIGHALGLHHPFDEYEGTKPAGKCHACQEHTHPTLASTTHVSNWLGDYCSDTSAQPESFVCETPSGRDCLGRRWTHYAGEPSEIVPPWRLRNEAVEDIDERVSSSVNFWNTMGYAYYATSRGNVFEHCSTEWTEQQRNRMKCFARRSFAEAYHAPPAST